MVFFVHLAAALDNWDPRIIDQIAKNRHVVAFDQLGVGASSGQVPGTLEEAAADAYRFITKGSGYDTIDTFRRRGLLSRGGFQSMWAAQVTVAKPGQI